MELGQFTRKLSIVALALGVTAGTIPGAAFAADSLQSQLSKNSSYLLGSQTTYISPKINTKSSANVHVIVQLSGQPAAVGKFAAKQGLTTLAKTATEATVAKEQSAVLNEAEDEGLDLTVNYKYNTVLNGFEVTLPANQVPKLADIAGVKSIYENSTWYPIPVEEADATINGTLSYGSAPLHQIGVDEVWNQNITGKGLKVGVIDTGVDYLHPDLKNAYKGGWDSFDNDPDPYEEGPNKDTGYEGSSHGTHVSGTIVGRAENPTSEIVQKGVAYEADLYVYRVLGYNPATQDASGSSAQVIDGIEHAVEAGMDVINLSLGSDAEKDVNSPDAIAINNAVLSGVTAVIANGNAGPGEYTLGSPATSQLGISVGAATSPAKNYHVSFKPSVANVTYDTYSDLNVMAWELGEGNDDFAGIIGTDPVKAVYAGLGSVNDFSKLDPDAVKDSIAFVSRGTLAFTEKIANAKAFGAKAIVIFNGIGSIDKNGNSVVDLSEHISGRDSYIANNIGDVYNSIPTFDMKGTEGRSLAKIIIASGNDGATFTFGSDYNETDFLGDTLASFTSEGPNVDDKLSIKPDFVAPGVGILSTWPAYQKYNAGASYDEAYNRISGTSMATPHVAGLALLLKQAHPTWGPFEIRAALANTADVLPGYDVYEQGAGRVNVANAVYTPAVLESVEPIKILDENFNWEDVTNYNSSANFGVVVPGTSATENLQLKNTSDKSAAYTASVEWHGQEPAGITAALSQSGVSTVASATEAFSLKVDVANGTKSGFYEGQINLTPTTPGIPALHLPFSVYVGTQLPDSPVGIQEISLSNTVIYPNKSPKTTDLSYKLSVDDANIYEVDVYNLDDELIGYIDYNDTVSTATYFEPGDYTLKDIDGSYYKYDEEGNPVYDAKGNPVVANLTDGVYKLNIFYAYYNSSTKKISYDYNGFISLRVDNSTSGGGTTAPSTGTGGTVDTTSPTAAGTTLVEQGAKQVAVTPTVTTQNAVNTLTISDSALTTALTSANTAQNAIVISAPTVTGAAVLSLTADQVKKLGALTSDTTVIVSTKDSGVSLPVSLLKNAPEGAVLKLSITPAANAADSFKAGTTGSTVIGTPVSFEANWSTATGSTYLDVPNNTFIKRSFTVPGALQPNTAGVLFEENGKITPVASVFKAQADGTTLVTVSRPGFSTYAAVSRPAAFTDIAGSPAASDINALASKLIFQGTSATTFSPKSNLTRAEFTAILVRALGLRTDATVSFSDVSASSWYASDVAAAYKAGLILGVGKGKFAPTASVSRQEMAAILDRAVKLAGIELKASNPGFTPYSDNAQIASYAKDSVQTLTAAGILSSASGTSFSPKAPATREDIATALHQLLIKAGLSE